MGLEKLVGVGVDTYFGAHKAKNRAVRKSREVKRKVEGYGIIADQWKKNPKKQAIITVVALAGVGGLLGFLVWNANKKNNKASGFVETQAWRKHWKSTKNTYSLDNDYLTVY